MHCAEPNSCSVIQKITKTLYIPKNKNRQSNGKKKLCVKQFILPILPSNCRWLTSSFKGKRTYSRNDDLKRAVYFILFFLLIFTKRLLIKWNHRKISANHINSNRMERKTIMQRNRNCKHEHGLWYDGCIALKTK